MFLLKIWWRFLDVLIWLFMILMNIFQNFVFFIRRIELYDVSFLLTFWYAVRMWVLSGNHYLLGLFHNLSLNVEDSWKKCRKTGSHLIVASEFLLMSCWLEDVCIYSGLSLHFPRLKATYSKPTSFSLIFISTLNKIVVYIFMLFTILL